MTAARRASLVRFVSVAAAAWGAEESLLTLVRHRPPDTAPVELAAAGADLRERWRRDTGREATVVRAGRGRVGRVLRALPHVASAPRGSVVVLWDVDLVPLAVVLAPWLRLRRVRPFLDLHVTLAGARGRRRLRLLARALTGCMSISRYTAEQLAGACPVHVVQRPVERSGDAAPVASADGFTVAVVGRVDPEKGVVEAIRACEGVEDVRRVVVRGAPFDGSPGYLDDVLRAGAALTTARFAYEGRVPAGAAMDGVDVLLHWNRHEPAGRVVQEAQLAGRVAVVPDEGGASEFVEHEVTGLVYRAGSADDARRVLSTLTSGARQDLGRAARRVGRERYDAAARSADYFAALGARGEP